MYARLKITEVNEVTRYLSIEERCMLSVAYANYGGCIDEDFRKAAKDRLAEIGFVKYVNWQKTRGLFRNTAPERPATEIETIAWHCMNMRRVAYHIGVGGISACKSCCMYDADDDSCGIYGVDGASLDDKIVSVEYVEE